MTCEHCNGPGSGTDQCCWARAMEIKRFRKKVFHRYIIEVIFEMFISISSVVTDIITLIIYIKRNKWLLAALTALPVLLPTTVFTNVYMADEQRGYFQMSSDKGSEQSETTGENECKDESGESGACEEDDIEPEEETKQKCQNARICCRGMCHSIFHKDRHIRKRGMDIVTKYIRRSAKYFFGTLVLRFIAWTWYLKALVFGYKALRAPKRFMKMEPPDLHWSYELLIRLDFLQAALENAPQCVIQLYALTTDAEEDQALAILTLTFSFLDFVRVTTSVLWNIGKGPVVAKPGCYGSLAWKMINMCSWILLYFGRCCAIALVMASSENLGVLITTLALCLHMVFFGKLFSSKKLGVAAQKILVTAFISVFFLPELDSSEVDILIQFYYATILMENTFFIIPWRGMEFAYCVNTRHTGEQAAIGDSLSNPVLSFDGYNRTSTAASTPDQHCLIDPTIAVISVPAFTVLGMILRLAAARKMAKFKASHPDCNKPMKMEEKVANIYSRKWTTITIRELVSAFIRMLRKEVTPQQPHLFKKSRGSHPDSALPTISDQFAKELQASQTFIRKSFSMIAGRSEGPAKSLDIHEPQLHSPPPKDLETTSLSNTSTTLDLPDWDKTVSFPRSKSCTIDSPFVCSENPGTESQACDKEEGSEDQEDSIPKAFFTPACIQNSTAGSETLFSRSIGVKHLKVQSAEGSNILKVSWP